MPDSQSTLVIGLDPYALPGWESEADVVAAAIARGRERFDARGIEVELCLVAPDETAGYEIVERLESGNYSCVVIGGGLRTHEPLLELFEKVVNLVRCHAPGAAIAFNTTPESCVDAARRWLPAESEES